VDRTPTRANWPPTRWPACAEQVLAAGGRVDNVYGDRNLFCACVPIDAYKDDEVEA
jgi:hypothetical protein